MLYTVRPPVWQPVNVAAFTFWITVIMTVITLVISDTIIQRPKLKASVFSKMKMGEKLVTVGFKFHVKY